MILGNPEGLATVCEEIVRIAAFDYHPGYMLQHGLSAFSGRGADKELVKNFDAAAAWKESLNTYLRCPDP